MLCLVIIHLMAQKRCVIGVDLGGTNVRAMAVYEDGSPASPKFDALSRAQEGIEVVFDALHTVIRQAYSQAETPVQAIGVALPGHIDDEKGICRWAPNFGYTEKGVYHYWENVPIRQPLAEHFSIPIHIGNDANLAALGEYMFGKGQNSAHCLVMLTIGTGIGAGVVMSPYGMQGYAKGTLLLLGGNKGGFELGHMCIQYGGLESSAGLYGTIESYCQRDSIVHRAIHKLQHGRNSLLKDLVENDLSRVSPRLLTEAANQGDELAIEVWEEVGRYLGVALGNCVNLFAPDVLAVGGQISKAGHWLLDPAKKEARNVAIPSLFQDTTITLADLIEDAGILGGAAVALNSLNHKIHEPSPSVLTSSC